MSAQIVSFGSYAPKGNLSNEKLAPIMGFDPDWVKTNIGIESRTILSDGESTITMAEAAARKAMQNILSDDYAKPELREARGWTSEESILNKIRGIVCSTNTPPEFYPSSAAKVQAALGIGDCFCFDLQAGCSGWLYGTEVVRNMMAGYAEDELILVLGSDALSTQIHYHDRIGSLFGDGAGASLMSHGDETSQILAIDIGAIYSNALACRSGCDQDRNNYKMYEDGNEPNLKRLPPTMDGKSVLKLSLQTLDKSFTKIFSDTGLATKDVTHFVPHQTNSKVVQKFCSMIDFPFEKVPMTLAERGSISSAGLPTHFEKLMSMTDVKRGDLVLMCTYGAGFTYGAMLFRY